MPQLRNKVIVYAACAAIAASAVLGGTRIQSNNSALSQQRQEDTKLCHYNGVVRDIFVLQLRGALVRVRASVPKDNPIRRQQERVLTKGIKELQALKC